MDEKVILELKSEVEKIARENDQERFRIVSGKLQDIIDMIAVVSLENTMLFRGMDQLIVQRLGTSFLQDKENKEALKKINKILDRINERNGITQRSFEDKIADFKGFGKRAKTNGERVRKAD